MTTTPTVSPLTGTLPVRPFGASFAGVIEADGQAPRVAALATTIRGEVVLLSLVGFSTSAAAALARLHAGKGLAFRSAPEVEWRAPHTLARLKTAYKQYQAPLSGTREKHLLSLSRQADIGWGLLHPPTVLPVAPQEAAATGETTRQRPPTPTRQEPTPRYLLGNAEEPTPARAAFLGHLRALRVIHLSTWADALWAAGLEQRLVLPLPAVGVRAWELSGDLARWSALLTQGVQAGWLEVPPPPRS
jgi:hypothetical protein